MDMNGMVAVGGSFVLGIGMVSAAILKYGPKIAKWFKVAALATDMANDWIEYIQPNATAGETKPTLTEDEVKELIADFQKLQTAWKA